MNDKLLKELSDRLDYTREAGITFVIDQNDAAELIAAARRLNALTVAEDEKELPDEEGGWYRYIDDRWCYFVVGTFDGRPYALGIPAPGGRWIKASNPEQVAALRAENERLKSGIEKIVDSLPLSPSTLLVDQPARYEIAQQLKQLLAQP